GRNHVPGHGSAPVLRRRPLGPPPSRRSPGARAGAQRRRELDARRVRKWFFLVPPLLAMLIGAGLGLLLRPPSDAPGPDPVAIANATLLSAREQGRQIVFAGRFAAIVTATESRLSLTARKTLVLPRQVRY